MDAAATAAPARAPLSARRAYAPQETAESVALLRQGIDLIDGLPGGAYAASPSIAPGGGVGKHIRHCIDVYECFLRGVRTGFIDYTQRGRDRIVEIDRRDARRRLESIVREMVHPPARTWAGPLKVRPEQGAPGEWIPSTVPRELEFVASHALHHYAIVALLLRAAGIEPPAGFGVAPSTLRAALRYPRAAPPSS